MFRLGFINHQAMEEMENSSVVLPSPLATIIDNTLTILENDTNLQEVRRIFSICDVKEGENLIFYRSVTLLRILDC